MKRFLRGKTLALAIVVTLIALLAAACGGDEGLQGSPGAQGSSGSQGLAGPQGDQGPQGEPGDQGQQGITGFPGFPGVSGVQGVSGPSLNAKIELGDRVHLAGVVSASAFGAGFAADELVALTLHWPDASESSFGIAVASDNGTFLLNSPPQTLGPGLYGVVAQGAEGSSASAPLSVVTSLSEPQDIFAAREATRQYLDVAVALASGYGASEECVSAPPGTMGFHYANLALLEDISIDPSMPEILLYVPEGDGVRLVAVEYVLAIGPPGSTLADLDPEAIPPSPSVFGQTFEGPMDGHGPGDPPHYDLHVWMWEVNPTGIFADFNPSPNVSC